MADQDPGFRRQVTNYPITRGSGLFDLLPNSGSGSDFIELISTSLSSGSSYYEPPLWHLRRNTSGSSAVYWSFHGLLSGTPWYSIPGTNTTYYVTYTYPVDPD